MLAKNNEMIITRAVTTVIHLQTSAGEAGELAIRHDREHGGTVASEAAEAQRKQLGAFDSAFRE